MGKKEKTILTGYHTASQSSEQFFPKPWSFPTRQKLLGGIFKIISNFQKFTTKI
jgi:hypothetical protein